MTSIHTSKSLKSVREAVCVAQMAIGNFPDAATNWAPYIAILQTLADDIERQRPLDRDCKHRRHTSTCGCVDEPAVIIDNAAVILPDPPTITLRRWLPGDRPVILHRVHRMGLRKPYSLDTAMAALSAMARDYASRTVVPPQVAEQMWKLPVDPFDAKAWRDVLPPQHDDDTRQCPTCLQTYRFSRVHPCPGKPKR